MTLNAETDALLKILEVGARQMVEGMVEGKVLDAAEAIAELRRKTNERQSQLRS